MRHSSPHRRPLTLPCLTQAALLAQRHQAGIFSTISDLFVSEERARVQRRVAGFDWKTSTVWTHLTEIYGPNLIQDELVSIADLLASRLEIPLDRDARRRKAVLVKWFDENWNAVEPLLNHVILDPNSPDRQIDTVKPE